jgi:hypothetical protein
MSDPQPHWLSSVAPEHVDAIGNYVAARLRGEKADLAPETAKLLEGETGPVFVGMRTTGALQFSQYRKDQNQHAALQAIIDGAVEELDTDQRSAIETVEVCPSYDFREHRLAEKQGRSVLRSNVWRGLRGVECEFSGQIHYLWPTLMLEQNFEWKDAFEDLRKRVGVSQETFESKRVTTRQFSAAQVLVFPREKRATALFRGLRVIPVSEVTQEGVERLQDFLGNYLYNNVQEDGRLIYMYEPGQDSEPGGPDNMIRQWMATIAMGRTAHHRSKDKKFYDITERNIRFNLRNYYRATGSLGLIEYYNTVKLGAVALAAIALVEHPSTHFSRPQRKLYNLIEHLWQPTGRFKTFYKPADQDVAHNFYPGEAMLAWSYRLEKKIDQKLLDKFMASYRHYREWHLEHRNPAFIPWHTQAYFKVFQQTKDKELVDWIFEMNDWLIAEMQQWDEVMTPDAMGRFYNPNKNYGPPHASSTGVYMEGIIDAFCLAREFGDDERRERYRVSLIRGLRSCMQLTYWNDEDMFLVKDKDATRGGVRTTIYNNRIRVDNVQHNLLAILKILQNFEKDDFVHP